MLKKFVYFVQFDLLEFQRFCFERSSCHPFNTSSFWCEYRINHFIEFITGQKFLTSFPSHEVLYIVSKKKRFVFGHFWLFLQNKQPTLVENSKITVLKDYKRSQEDVSLSLAKRKLAETNKWKFFNQLGEVRYASIIYHTNRRRSFFYLSVTLFRVWFYDS